MIRFGMGIHGLGDQSNAVHCLRPWLDRGHQLEIAAGPFKWLWESCGYTVCDHAQTHPWWEPEPSRDHNLPWSGSKVGRNLEHPSPLRRIAPVDELWPEVLANHFDLTACVSEAVRTSVAEKLADLPRPIFAVHSRGHTNPDAKNFPPHLEAETIDALSVVGSVLYLDWSGGTKLTTGCNFRRASGYDVETLYALISYADVLIGIDSGPYHLARLTKTPRVGCWWGIPPWHAAIPRVGDVNLFAVGNSVTAFKAADFHIREVPEITAGRIVDTVCQTATPSP